MFFHTLGTSYTSLNVYGLMVINFFTLDFCKTRYKISLYLGYYNIIILIMLGPLDESLESCIENRKLFHKILQ